MLKINKYILYTNYNISIVMRISKYLIDTDKKASKNFHKKDNIFTGNEKTKIKTILSDTISSTEENKEKLENNDKLFEKEIKLTINLLEKEKFDNINIENVLDLYNKSSFKWNHDISHSIQLLLNIIIPWIKVETKKHYKNNLVENLQNLLNIINNKTSYELKEIINTIETLAISNNIKVDFYISKGDNNYIYKLNENNSAYNEYHNWENSIPNKLKIIRLFRFNYTKLFQNLIINSKEAGATKLDIQFNLAYFGWKSKQHIVYNDNWSGMNENTIDNVLFEKWKSTKNRDINKWEWMNLIYKLLKKQLVNTTVSSNQENWKYISKTFVCDWIASKDTIIDHSDSVASYPMYKKWTQFVFSFKK